MIYHMVMLYIIDINVFKHAFNKYHDFTPLPTALLVEIINLVLRKVFVSCCLNIGLMSSAFCSNYEGAINSHLY